MDGVDGEANGEAEGDAPREVPGVLSAGLLSRTLGEGRDMGCRVLSPYSSGYTRLV